eukprot:6166817-Pleurochrysis_carterae.AAC.1
MAIPSSASAFAPRRMLSGQLLGVRIGDFRGRCSVASIPVDPSRGGRLFETLGYTSIRNQQ